MKLRDVLMGTTILRAPDTEGGSGGAVDAEFQDLDELLDEDPGDADEHLDPDPEDGGDQDQQHEDPQPQQRRREPSRYEREIAETRRRAQQAEDDLRREREDRLRDQQSRQRHDAEADFERRLEMMSPEERIEARAARREQALQARLDQMEFTSADRSDRAEFDALCSQNKAYASVQKLVEERLAELRRSGVTASRKIIAEREIGRLAVERATRARPKAERDAAASRTRETTRPASARSDAQRTAGDRGLSPADAARKRMEGVKI